jgi:hypothetical protein
MTLEADGDRCPRAVAVLVHDQVGLADALAVVVVELGR